jgi:hypothetical protein
VEVIIPHQRKQEYYKMLHKTWVGSSITRDHNDPGREHLDWIYVVPDESPEYGNEPS